jgi:hypothetical protein
MKPLQEDYKYDLTPEKLKLDNVRLQASMFGFNDVQQVPIIIAGVVAAIT